MYNCIWYFCICIVWVLMDGMSYFASQITITITMHAIKRHFLIWMMMVRQPTECQCSCVLTLKYTFVCVYWWTRQRIHNTLIVVDRYLWFMRGKVIPDSAEPHLESFYLPFVAGIGLPHQGVVDSHSLQHDKDKFGYMIHARILIHNVETLVACLVIILAYLGDFSI